MMTDTYDALIVGGGHNGLVCGAYLARAGLKVAVVERAPQAGGCILSDTPAGLPGYVLDLGGLEHGRLWGSRIVAELGLDTHGLLLIPREAYVAGIFPGGRALTIWRDLEATCASIARICPADAAAYRRFVAASAGIVDLLDASGQGPPPRFSTLARLGALLPRGRLDACVRLFMQSSRAVLDEWFQSDELKALIGSYATHTQLPPWQGGGGYMSAVLTGIHRRGMPARPCGGSGAFIASLLACLRSQGAEVLTGCGVRRVLVERGRAVGVQLEDGASLRARQAVVSAVDARRLLLDLLAETDISPGYRQEARRIRVAGDNVGEMSVGVALSGLPDVGPEISGADFTGTSYVAPTPRYLEEAFLDIARGELPARPALMWSLPSTTDTTLAPPGAHTLWLAAFVPWKLRDGRSWDDVKEEMADRVLATLAEYAPNLPGLVRGRVVMSPLDWSRRTGNLAGSADHVDQTLDQMLGNRPSPRLAGYRAPIERLYLTGAGTHPGGGIGGIPGRNTAQVVLHDLGCGRWPAARERFVGLLARGGTAVRGWRALDDLNRR